MVDWLDKREAGDLNWKPKGCADCGKPHPSYSRDGGEGPWRCQPCHAIAKPKPVEDPFADRTPDASGQTTLL